SSTALVLLAADTAQVEHLDQYLSGRAVGLARDDHLQGVRHLPRHLRADAPDVAAQQPPSGRPLPPLLLLWLGGPDSVSHWGPSGLASMRSAIARRHSTACPGGTLNTGMDAPPSCSTSNTKQ